MAAAPPAELVLQQLEAGQDCRRVERALDQRDRIGEVAAGAAVGRVEDNRRGIEQAELPVESCDRGFDHAGGSAKATVGAIGADRDRVEV